MKRYIIFIVSFMIVFLMLQVLTGMILTFVYTPDIKEAWSLSANLPQETVLKGSHHLLHPLLIIFLSSTIAYVFSYKMTVKRVVEE